MRFQDLLGQQRVDVAPEGHQHSRQGWVNFDCPFCGKGLGKYHMGFNARTGRVSCWKCGMHSLRSVLNEYGIPYKESRGILDKLEIDRTWVTKARTGLKLPKAAELLPPHRRYLKKRGFDPDEIQRIWGIQGIGPISKLSWRILIPIQYQGITVSWTARSIGNSEMRYISASAEEESMDHKTLLYGEDFVRHCAIVHEGPLDVWAMGPGAVCTFGLAYTPSQVLKLSRYPIRVICFDKGKDAQRRARDLCDALEVFPGETYHLQLESGDDAADADKKELRAVRKRFL